MLFVIIVGFFAIIGSCLLGLVAGAKSQEDAIKKRAVKLGKMYYKADTGEVVSDDPVWNRIINGDE